MSEPFAGHGLSCARVWDDGMPVLSIYHNANGDWQFLCGGDEHEDSSVVRVLHGHHLAERDPSILLVADLPTGYYAERETAESPWEIFEDDEEDEEDEGDDPEAKASGHEHVHERDLPRGADGYNEMERRCLANIERTGFHVWQIPAGEEDDGFSYTVGLYKTYGHPELIVFGQKTAWQGTMIDAIVADIRAGTVYRNGDTNDALLPGYTCRFDAIGTAEAYTTYLGWDIWYYYDVLKASVAPVLQLVWPDKNGNFPESSDYHSYRQPLIGTRAPST